MCRTECSNYMVSSLGEDSHLLDQHLHPTREVVVWHKVEHAQPTVCAIFLQHTCVD